MVRGEQKRRIGGGTVAVAVAVVGAGRSESRRMEAGRSKNRRMGAFPFLVQLVKNRRATWNNCESVE
jgi:hypothetical protein